ncbi:MAG: hypothetical protein FWG44_04015 [Oscillospiraceae bacterium]|nr:hypothetical protein [Oscillospiraceae bacterium]
MLIVSVIIHAFRKTKKPLITAVIVFGLTYLLPLLELSGIRIDFTGSLLYYTVIFTAIYLGSGLGFYDRYAWWDIMIHFLSGAAFVSLGIALTANTGNLSRINILFFCVTLSVFLHVVWEVAEYICDSFLRTNHQRWQKSYNYINHKSESVIQPSGLVDTMNDTLYCIAGTFIACILWWFAL